MKSTLLTATMLIAAGTFGLTANSFASGTHTTPHAPKAQQHMGPGQMHNDKHMNSEIPGHPHEDDDDHASKAGEPGNPKKPARIVLLAMREGDGKMFFTPSKFNIRKGEQIRFKIRNAGVLAHELVIGTHDEISKHRKLMQRFPDMEHDDPNSIRLKETQSGEILWKFTRAGKFQFACLIQGHMEAGMKGTFIVKARATK